MQLFHFNDDMNIFAPFDRKALSIDDPRVAAEVARLEMNESFYRKLEEMFPVPTMTGEQLATMNHALGHPKDADYRPYCMKLGCTRMPRMFRVAEGFACWACQNIIGFDLRRIERNPVTPGIINHE